MLSPGVRAIFFDAVGTLIHPDPPAPLVYRAAGRRFGSRLSAPDITRRFAAAFQHEEDLDRQRGLRTSEVRERERWRRIVAGVLDDVADGEACFQELYRQFSLPEAWRLEPDVAPVLEELARRGYTLGLASNYDHRLRSVVAGLPALRGLDHLVISSEVGWRKPAPEFFAALGRTAGYPPHQILYIGDDLGNDYEGARAAGLEALLFDPRDRHPGGVPRIQRLGDLIGRPPPAV
jgi:putative hydrolase of the HAD superfamily